MRFINTIILLIWLSVSWSQVSLNNLVRFNSKAQQQAFSKLQNGDTALLELLVYATKETTTTDYEQYKTRLAQIEEELDSAKLRRKSPKKQIKTVFNAVHDNLLVKYEFENNFCEVFTTGYYNCVSATALYSYMLEGLGIPHAVVETPNHVYTVAVLDDEEWVLESTQPQQGYYELTKESFEASLDALVAQKVISQEERNSADIDSILNELYPSRPISTNRLVAIQYTNLANYHLEKTEYDEALQNAIKARLIDADESTTLVLQTCLAYWIDNHPFEDTNYFKNLQYLASIDTAKFTRNQLTDVLIYYGNTYINDSLNTRQFTNYSQALLAGFAQGGIDTNKVYALTQGFFAQKQLLNLNGLEAIKHAQKALLVDSSLSHVYTYLIGGLGLLERGQELPRAQILDTALVLDLKFETLKVKPLWNTLVSEFFLLCMLDELELGHINTSTAYQKRFEAFASEEQRHTKHNLQLVEIYYKSLALKSYNQSRGKAKLALQKGLEFAPNSQQLRQTSKILGFN